MGALQFLLQSPSLSSIHLIIFSWKLKFLRFIYWVWTCVQHLQWRLDGTAHKLHQIESGLETACPAQVLKVIWRNPYNFFLRPETLFTRHERFAPASIIDNKRVHLLSVNSRTATFTEVDQDILDTRKFPFFHIGQTRFTTRLIILPVKIFYKLVDKVDIEDKRVVWLFHTARCGSTTWVHAFNSIPNSFVLSEPQVLHYAMMFGDHGYSSVESYAKSDDCKKVVEAIIKISLRHSPKNAIVLWKPGLYAEHFIDIIVDCFPRHILLATYRDIVPSLTSFYKSFYHVLSLRYVLDVDLTHDPQDDKWWFHIPNTGGFTNGYDHIFCREVITRIQPRSGIEWFCFMWAAKVVPIRCAIERGRNVKCFKYDSLLEDRRQLVAKIFGYLDLAEHTDAACETFNFDSQAGVDKVSWEVRKKGDGLEWCQDGEAVKRCNMILEAFGFSGLNESIELPNGF